jgi:hypothetical protein
MNIAVAALCLFVAIVLSFLENGGSPDLTGKTHSSIETLDSAGCISNDDALSESRGGKHCGIKGKHRIA